MATDNHAAPAWPPKQEPQDARPADTPRPRALRGGLTGRAWHALV
ncbi:hypothetical protein [Burkholderia multivorans]|nr:hypothetical protein [Burkholderia multivorans]